MIAAFTDCCCCCCCSALLLFSLCVRFLSVLYSSGVAVAASHCIILEPRESWQDFCAATRIDGTRHSRRGELKFFPLLWAYLAGKIFATLNEQLTEWGEWGKWGAACLGVATEAKAGECWLSLKWVYQWLTALFNLPPSSSPLPLSFSVSFSRSPSLSVASCSCLFRAVPPAAKFAVAFCHFNPSDTHNRLAPQTVCVCVCEIEFCGVFLALFVTHCLCVCVCVGVGVCTVCACMCKIQTYRYRYSPSQSRSRSRRRSPEQAQASRGAQLNYKVVMLILVYEWIRIRIRTNTNTKANTF